MYVAYDSDAQYICAQAAVADRGWRSCMKHGSMEWEWEWEWNEMNEVSEYVKT